MRRWIAIGSFALSCSSPNGTKSSVVTENVSPGDEPAPVVLSPSVNEGPSQVEAESPAPAARTVTTTIVVRYPARCRTMTLRGAPSNDPGRSAPLSWSRDTSLSREAETTFVFRTDAIDTAFEVKPMCDGTWSRGPNFKVSPGAEVTIYPRFFTTNGRYETKWSGFASAHLPKTRGILVYTPPTYLENDQVRMDVLYMHDGQNLFNPGSSFGGREWTVDETLDRGAEDGSIREVLVVGIENTSDRIAELTPTPDPSDGGGRAEDYLAMLETEIKPLVDRTYRTNPEREHTGIMGSSLGGLISVYAGVRHGGTFGLVGAMSPSTWWDGRVILREIASSAASARAGKFYVDSGTPGDDSTNTRELANALRAKGYVDGDSLRYVTEPGGQHNEGSWSRRLPAALAWLLGPGR